MNYIFFLMSLIIWCGGRDGFWDAYLIILNMNTDSSFFLSNLHLSQYYFIFIFQIESKVGFMLQEKFV